MRVRHQNGMMLIEALIALLVFSLGILGMVAMGGTAIGAQSDARYRTDAARFADDIASKIAVGVDRTSATALQTSLDTYNHRASGDNCAFSGGVSTNEAVTAWESDIQGNTSGVLGLPGTSDVTQQIIVNTSAGQYNRVEITICWKGPSDTAMRHHTLVTYVNGSA